MELRHCFTQVQQQRVAAATVQGVKLLTMTYFDLNTFLTETAIGNPFLNFSEQPGYALADGYDDVLSSISTPFESDTLMGSLRLQLSLCNLTPVEAAIGKDILGNLDERGYFVGDINSICLFYQVKPKIGERVLKIIQGFTPRGIAARDVFECLCLQISNDEPYAETIKSTIMGDFELVGKNQVAKCARKYKLSEDVMQAIFKTIHSLNLYPGNQRTEQPSVTYTVPDILVQKESGNFNISVRGEENVSLNKEYIHMLSSGVFCSNDEKYLRTMLSEAKFIAKSVFIRQQTIRKFTLALLRLQNCFFARGEAHLRPLTMQEVANEANMHVATVSRVVKNKYIYTPWGMYSLRYFFAGGCKNKHGSHRASVYQVKHRIKTLIDGEDADNPLTDTQICSLLEKEKYQISRRTVTKYRQSMNLENQIRRKK